MNARVPAWKYVIRALDRILGTAQEPKLLFDDADQTVPRESHPVPAPDQEARDCPYLRFEQLSARGDGSPCDLCVENGLGAPARAPGLLLLS